jgi:hypothetical protein
MKARIAYLGSLAMFVGGILLAVLFPTERIPTSCGGAIECGARATGPNEHTRLRVAIAIVATVVAAVLLVYATWLANPERQKRDPS